MESQFPIVRHGRGQWPDRRGEYWGICPFHADTKPGAFSFSERGFTCFACGEAGGLVKLGQRLGVGDTVPLMPRRALAPKPAATWQPDWTRDPNYWQRYLPLPDIALEYYHRRGFTADSAERWRLGWGVLPASRCKHPRAILPVFDGGRLVALRGRAVLAEDTDEKWLQSAGSAVTLFGAETLALGRRLIVTEAPYSVILAMQKLPAPTIAAVAGTAGAGCWRDEWTERIAHSKPYQVRIWFDNDEAGWESAKKVAVKLVDAGIRQTYIHRWQTNAPKSADLADFLTGRVA